jgi:glutathione-regulated potassium-efflux system ancillary protein KefF
MYWYSVPGLLKHWFDKVLVHGFAYGHGGHALHGKRFLWAFTTGGDEEAFTPSGMHGHPLRDFVPPIEQTARFCGMRWEAPNAVLGAHRIGPEDLAAHAEAYRARLVELARLVQEDAEHG